MLDGAVNLAAIPLNMKEPKVGETNSLGKHTTKASSSSPGSNNPLGKFKLLLMVVKEESKVLNDQLPKRSKVLGSHDNWAISHRGKKRLREDSETLSSNESEGEDDEEEELPKDNLATPQDKEDELSQQLQLKE